MNQYLSNSSEGIRIRAFWRGARVASVVWGLFFVSLMIATSRMADALVELVKYAK